MNINHLNKRRQIAVKLVGGLGNQLFQYAAGRGLAIRNKSALVLDRRFLERSTTAHHGLHHFNLGDVVQTEGNLPPQKETERMRYYLWRRLGLTPRLVKERGLSFNAQLMRPTTNVYLDGYWQSELYFLDVADRIREDLRIITRPDHINQSILEEIASRPAISLHVRRGDYTLPNVQAVHGSCTEQYYLNAVRLIAEQASIDPVVYAFSDEPDWVKENLSLPFEMRVISHNNANTNYEDLRLMSACRHHVVANSSFSWWGAWLNPSPDKIVVAPRRWFADPSYKNQDITPPSWHRLEN